ncbi:MAG: TIGR00266 family protein [Betaproteobacteria bacterium]|nr:TIGR00266 family protein [Betaproteobacteria bacterium]
MHPIDYDILGDDMQYVEIVLDPGEAAIGEAGALMFMQAGVELETVFGDASDADSGLLGKLAGAGKRLLTGESLFTTVYANRSAESRRIAFAAPYPGKIIPVRLDQIGGRLVCQKDAFLCAAKGVGLGLAFQRRLGAGFFGGEGFILQSLEGDGTVFIHAGGAVAEKTLAPGEVLRVDTGCLAALQPSVDYDIQFVGGIKTAMFGGEGLFLAKLTGPGRVWLQSLPLSRLAGRVFAAAPQGGGRQTGESGGHLAGDRS